MDKEMLVSFNFIPFDLCTTSTSKKGDVKISLLPPTASMVSSAEIPLPIDHTVSPSLKLVVYVNEVITSVWLDPSLFLVKGCIFSYLGRRATRH